MLGSEYKDEVYRLKFMCGFNHRYHQIVAARWRNIDRALRIALGLLAVVGLTLSMPGIDFGWWGFAVAFVSLAVAVILNILPVGDWEKSHNDFLSAMDRLLARSGKTPRQDA